MSEIKWNTKLLEMCNDYIGTEYSCRTQGFDCEFTLAQRGRVHFAYNNIEKTGKLSSKQIKHDLINLETSIGKISELQEDIDIVHNVVLWSNHGQTMLDLEAYLISEGYYSIELENVEHPKQVNVFSKEYFKPIKKAHKNGHATTLKT